jgi:hypothetical protein
MVLVSLVTWPMAGSKKPCSLIRYMVAQDMLTALHRLPRDAELLAFEPGCEESCEHELDEVEWQGSRAYLHLGVRRDAGP